ncbi:hypothetical protein BDR26DRAFT_868701, partial [Obelidium mucronatum]
HHQRKTSQDNSNKLTIDNKGTSPRRGSFLDLLKPVQNAISNTFKSDATMSAKNAGRDDDVDQESTVHKGFLVATRHNESLPSDGEHKKKKNNGTGSKNASMSKFSLFDAEDGDLDGFDNDNEKEPVPALPTSVASSTSVVTLQKDPESNTAGTTSKHHIPLPPIPSTTQAADTKNGSSYIIKRRNTFQGGSTVSATTSTPISRKESLSKKDKQKQQQQEQQKSMFSLHAGSSDGSIESLKASRSGQQTQLVSSVGSSRQHIVITTIKGGDMLPIVSGGLEDAIIAGQVDSGSHQDDNIYEKDGSGGLEEEVVEIGRASEVHKKKGFLSQLLFGRRNSKKSNKYTSPN